MEIRKANKNDVSGMVDCHQNAFPGQPMTEMGTGWLTYLYTYFIEHPKGLSLVAVDKSGSVIGLAVGGDTAIRAEFIKKATSKYFYVFPLKFFTSRVIRKKFLQKCFSRLYRQKKIQTIYENIKQVNGEKAVLLSICVSHSCRGTVASGLLIQKFYELIINNYAAVRLTVRSENIRARKFYEKNGWTLTFENEQEAKYLKLSNDCK